MEHTLNRRIIISELTKSTHGDLEAYVPITSRAAQHDPDFMSHLIAWNAGHGTIDDSKIAMPFITLNADLSEAHVENALAHLAKLDPRRLLKGQRKLWTHTGHKRAYRRMIQAYLDAREHNGQWWRRTAIQYRRALHELYALNHIKPGAGAQDILFDGRYAPGTTWGNIRDLANMTPGEAAQAIRQHRIPFLVANPARGKGVSECDLYAMMEGMTRTEIVTNRKRLSTLGADTYATTRSLLEGKLAQKAAPRAILKDTVAAQAIGDTKASRQLQGSQERQLDATVHISGDWIILADKSGSMEAAIEATRQVAAIVARLTEGKVHLIWFDDDPRYMDATGMTYEALCQATASVTAGGQTAIGRALMYALHSNLEADGIILISDGGENVAPHFHDACQKYATWLEKDIPLHFLRIGGDRLFRYRSLHGSSIGKADVLSHNLTQAGVEFQPFTIDSMDHYSLLNIVQTLRPNQYSLVDEIFQTPLLTIEEALTRR